MHDGRTHGGVGDVGGRVEIDDVRCSVGSGERVDGATAADDQQPTNQQGQQPLNAGLPLAGVQLVGDALGGAGVDQLAAEAGHLQGRRDVRALVGGGSNLTDAGVADRRRGNKQTVLCYVVHVEYLGNGGSDHGLRW